MEIREIMRIFREEKNETNKRGAVTHGEMEVAGMIAVINALRNDEEFLKTWEESQLAKARKSVVKGVSE